MDKLDTARPRRKQRKPRPCYSCKECRRLKMKCDRRVPCSNCVRRHRVNFCGGTSEPASREELHPQTRHQQDTRQPQRPQGSVEHDESVATLYPCAANRDSELLRQAHQLNVSQTPLPEFGLDSLNIQTRSCRPDSMPIGGVAAPAHIVSNRARTYGDYDSQRLEHGEQSGSDGTLMLSQGGGSRYLGPTAGSEWLKDSQTRHASEPLSATGAVSPEVSQGSVSPQPSHLNFSTGPVAFPFNETTTHMSSRNLLSHLPPREEAWTLVESYYRYCAWHHDVAPKALFSKTFNRVYALSDSQPNAPPVNSQEIALVFIIMALGTIFNIEMPMYDSSAEDWLHLSERALVKGDFLSNNTVAGLQTLHLMAHMHLQYHTGRRGDDAWPLWGIVMRLIQAMGMHRDGIRWNLPKDVTEERRKVFWECHAADVFQAHCFSRPCSINPEHCDTAFPSEIHTLLGEKSYYTLRFELSQLSSEILNMAMKVRKPSYSNVTELDFRLSEFERTLPFYLRCRAAFVSMPSRFPEFEAAIDATPEPSRRSMTVSFQQTNLAINISETIINLHRPYYAKALYDDVEINGKSLYGPSFFAVVERCAVIIAAVSDIHARFPAVSTRQWSFWYHVFGSALCLGTLVLRDPSNAMATFVLTQIEATIALFSSLIQHGANTPKYQRNLEWLMKLHEKASSRIADLSIAEHVDSGRETRSDRGQDYEQRQDCEDLDLLGWRTRLIERAGQGRQASKVHPADATPIRSHTVNISTLPLRDTSVFMQSASVSPMTSDSMNELLREFWDPMLLDYMFQASHKHANVGHQHD